MEITFTMTWLREKYIRYKSERNVYVAIGESEDRIFSFYDNVMFHCTIHAGLNTGRLHIIWYG